MTFLWNKGRWWWSRLWDAYYASLLCTYTFCGSEEGHTEQRIELAETRRERESNAFFDHGYDETFVIIILV